MSFTRLYEELKTLNLQHHVLEDISKEAVMLVAKSLDPEGVDEVMRIKKIADKYGLVTVWDGKNIEIRFKKK